MAPSFHYWPLLCRQGLEQTVLHFPQMEWQNQVDKQCCYIPFAPEFCYSGSIRVLLARQELKEFTELFGHTMNWNIISLAYSIHEQKYMNLPTFWTIWAHDKTDTDWTKDSYMEILKIYTIDDFWLFFRNFTDFTRHQFYIMRGTIPPVYECPANINGGSFSWKFYDHRQTGSWFTNITAYVITKNIFRLDGMNSHITCVYLNPRDTDTVIKIWVRDHNKMKEMENHFSRCFRELRLGKMKRTKHNNVKEGITKVNHTKWIQWWSINEIE